MEYIEKPLDSLDVVYQGPSQELKQVALTFDDGPDKYWTVQILNVLSHYNVKATFFCLGEMIQQNPEIFVRIADAGHIIGNHTWNHPYLTEISQAEVRRQIEITNEIIYQLIGVRPSLFRAPHGKYDEKALHEVISFNCKTIQWTIDSEDFLGLDASQVLANILPHVQPGSIILQHCAAYDHNFSMSGTVLALETLIEKLQNQDYQFVLVSEMLGIPAYH